MRYELILKPFITKLLDVFILFAVVFNLGGCIFLLNLPSDTQNIILKAEDGGEYDFYVDNTLVCPHTDRCVFVHNKMTLCQHTIDIKRGEVVYGTSFYGYWEERPALAKMLVERDDKKCPEEWEGAIVIVEINPEQ